MGQKARLAGTVDTLTARAGVLYAHTASLYTLCGAVRKEWATSCDQAPFQYLPRVEQSARRSAAKCETGHRSPKGIPHEKEEGAGPAIPMLRDQF